MSRRLKNAITSLVISISRRSTTRHQLWVLSSGSCCVTQVKCCKSTLARVWWRLFLSLGRTELDLRRITMNRKCRLLRQLQLIGRRILHKTSWSCNSGSCALSGITTIWWIVFLVHSWRSGCILSWMRPQKRVLRRGLLLLMHERKASLY